MGLIPKTTVDVSILFVAKRPLIKEKTRWKGLGVCTV